MHKQQFLSVYNESRNGLNSRIRHPLARKLVYSDGVRDCADTGMYWVLDIVGTECVSLVMNDESLDGSAFLYIDVKDDRAKMTLVRDSGEPPVWTKDIEYTDMPEGRWCFYLSADVDHVLMYLPTEY
jgi:hypothetical protein